MKNKNLQGGFAPLLIIAIIAILAIGGGAYVVKKNKDAKNAQLEDNLDTQANANADANANENANLGINAKGSLRSLLGVGRNVMCTFTSTAGGTNSSGTVYISADGSMRGDFTAQTSAGTQTSSMIVKGETSYFWSGSQGIKMNVKEKNTSASTEAKSDVDLDSQVDYKCSNWAKDESKFTVPTSVKFLDVGAMMKSSSGVDVKAMMKTSQ